MWLSVFNEVCKFVLSMCPNEKNFVNKTPPYRGLIWCLYGAYILYPNIAHTASVSNYKDTSNQRPANQPNNQRFIVYTILLIFIYFVAVFPLICVDIETNPGPKNIFNQLNDNQKTLLNKIRRTQLQLIRHLHHLDFLLAQTTQHTVPKGLISKSVPNANLQVNLYTLWYQNTLIFAQSQMHLLIKHHEHSIINLHSELNSL